MRLIVLKESATLPGELLRVLINPRELMAS